MGLPFLNEVLSLNAQEFDGDVADIRLLVFLNEVLSLNAQEFGQNRRVHNLRNSSMKS